MFNIYSEDPIASSDTVKSTPTEIPAREESVPVCLCQNCPDLEKVLPQQRQGKGYFY